MIYFFHELGHLYIHTRRGKAEFSESESHFSNEQEDGLPMDDDPEGGIILDEEGKGERGSKSAPLIISKISIF